MRKLRIATLALTATMLSTLAHAQTVDICDRPQELIDAISAYLGHEDCARGAAARPLTFAGKHVQPASNTERQSRLRLTNAGGSEESVSIVGVDDQGGRATVTLTLAAGQSRTLTAMDLEEGAMGLTGVLGDGVGKWRLFITAGDAVTGMSLLYGVSGHISNLSALGDEVR